MSTSSDQHFADELTEKLEQRGFTTIATADRCHDQSPPPPDLVAGLDGSLYLFAIRAGENPQTISAAAVDGVRAYAQHMGGAPRVAVRQYGSDWRFLHIEDLRCTNDDYRIDAATTTGVGCSIDDL